MVDRPKSSRYRKVSVRMWGDQKFLRLSAPPPSGRYLWVYLLTNQDTVNIPGLYRSGEAQMAEALEWPLKGFREAFEEVSREGLVQADWKARVVYIPRGIKYNTPESPNVVKSWEQTWDEIPECSLKMSAYQAIKAFLEAFGEAFLKAFLEACSEPQVAYPVTPSGNQEQEQEQEQEPKDSAPAGAVAIHIPKPKPIHTDFLERMKAAYERCLPGEVFKLDRAHFVIADSLIKKYGLETVTRKAGTLFALCQRRSAWFTKDGLASFSPETLSKHWNRIIPESSQPTEEEDFLEEMKRQEAHRANVDAAINRS